MAPFSEIRRTAMNCPHCHSSTNEREGQTVHGFRRFRCRELGRSTSGPARAEPGPDGHHVPGRFLEAALQAEPTGPLGALANASGGSIPDPRHRLRAASVQDETGASRHWGCQRESPPQRKAGPGLQRADFSWHPQCLDAPPPHPHSLGSPSAARPGSGGSEHLGRWE
jgi:hypothetical protein